MLSASPPIRSRSGRAAAIRIRLYPAAAHSAPVTVRKNAFCARSVRCAPRALANTLAPPMPNRLLKAVIMLYTGRHSEIAATAAAFPVRPTNHVSAKL